ncbi:10169_t:CDS:2, partial [Cetraspora pellucida]
MAFVPVNRNMRINENQDNFADWLLRLGDGSLPALDDEIEIPPRCIVSGDLIYDVFGEHLSKHDLENLYEKVILCPTNKECLTLNEEIHSHSDFSDLLSDEMSPK